MAINLGYGTQSAEDKNNVSATRLAEIVVRDSRVMRDTNPGVVQ